MVEVSRGSTPGDPARRRRAVALAAVVLTLLAVGSLARVTISDGAPTIEWLPWRRGPDVTFYYRDTATGLLVPVSRELPHTEAPAVTVVASFMAGPLAGTGLAPVLPSGVHLEVVDFRDGTLHVEVDGDGSPLEDPIVATAVHRSLSSWDEVATVALTRGGGPVEDPTGALLFFHDDRRDVLLVEPVGSRDPFVVLDAWLAGPSTPALTGLETRVIRSRLEADGLLVLDLRYTPSVRRFALDHPDSVRRVLEGLIATMVQSSPAVTEVYLEFEGQDVLGLGDCADLLRSRQGMPEVLNDERLLGAAG